jgi:hypothetical protein
VAVGAVVDEADLAVDAFEAAVGEASFDGGGDAVEVLADPFHEILERAEAAAKGSGAPCLEVGASVGRVDAAVELTELFFELPGPEQAVAAAAGLADEALLVGAEAFGTNPRRGTGVR